MKDYFTKNNVGIFALGFAAATLGVKALKSKSARNVAVKTLAQGMKIQDDAKECYENIKDEATDIAYDAKIESKKIKSED